MSLETLLRAANFVESTLDRTPTRGRPAKYRRQHGNGNKSGMGILPDNKVQTAVNSGTTLSSILDKEWCDQHEIGPREAHNKVEKNRRAHLKDCFAALKGEVGLADKKASNLRILRYALRYLQSLKRRQSELLAMKNSLRHDTANQVVKLARLRRDLRELNVDVDEEMFVDETMSDDDDDRSMSTVTADEDSPIISDWEDDVYSSSTTASLPSAGPLKEEAATAHQQQKPTTKPSVSELLQQAILVRAAQHATGVDGLQRAPSTPQLVAAAPFTEVFLSRASSASISPLTTDVQVSTSGLRIFTGGIVTTTMSASSANAVFTTATKSFYTHPSTTSHSFASLQPSSLSSGAILDAEGIDNVDVTKRIRHSSATTRPSGIPATSSVLTPFFILANVGSGVPMLNGLSAAKSNVAILPPILNKPVSNSTPFSFPVSSPLSATSPVLMAPRLPHPQSISELRFSFPATSLNPAAGGTVAVTLSSSPISSSQSSSSSLLVSQSSFHGPQIALVRPNKFSAKISPPVMAPNSTLVFRQPSSSSMIHRSVANAGAAFHYSVRTTGTTHPASFPVALSTLTPPLLSPISILAPRFNFSTINSVTPSSSVGVPQVNIVQSRGIVAQPTRANPVGQSANVHQSGNLNVSALLVRAASAGCQRPSLSPAPAQPQSPSDWTILLLRNDVPIRVPVSVACQTFQPNVSNHCKS